MSWAAATARQTGWRRWLKGRPRWSLDGGGRCPPESSQGRRGVKKSSNKDDRKIVLRARESGKGVLTAPFKLLGNRIGVILTFAVYKYELPSNARPHERIEAAIGYLGGIIYIEELVDKVLHEVAVKQSIMVNVYDTTTYDRPLSMYGSNDTGSGMCHVSPLCHVSTLNFNDPSRKHEMHCRFIQSPPWPWMAIMSPIGTLVIALLIATAITSSVGNLVIALLIAKRIARVEDEMIVLETHPEDAVPSLLFYLRRKVVSVTLLGLMLCIPVIGAFDLPFNQSLGIRREDENMMLNKFGWSHGRSLIDTLNGTWAEGGVENSDMIIVGLREMTGNNDSPGQQQHRYKIVLDLGNALLYLHRDCEKCIVHGDIKPANVMLDVSYNAKLGDFGLARLVEHGEESQTTQVVAGTPGYIDPEFITNRWPRAELDVYSFGVVLLEIACGKRPAWRQPNGASSLLAWAIRLYDQGMILDAADQRLNGEFDRQQMERVLVTGLWCAHRDPIQRPPIEQAMDVLRPADAELPVLRAVHDERHIRAMEEQAYGDLPVGDRSVHAVNTSTYFTSKDSAYLLAEE
ncbi:unnamed protein product [Miscanthus lutarioriparius]|uniref:Protein kinase domain-containing protein n=1 Tax=Miscanthus lutarioriparius TaxID=422564 RepID=A0A811RLB1_9POAL|nr:unnamed protein product [Miscanthus lutarioriparius]